MLLSLLVFVGYKTQRSSPGKLLATIDWPGMDGQVHKGDRHVIPADLCQVVCWDSHSREVFLTFLGIDAELKAAQVDFKALGQFLARENAPNKEAVRLAIGSLFFMMATKPPATAHISRPAKTKKAKAMAELWTPNIVGDGYICDAEIEEVQVRRLADEQGLALHQVRKSPRLHWRRAHWRRHPDRTKQPLLIRRQLIGLHGQQTRE